MPETTKQMHTPGPWHVAQNSGAPLHILAKERWQRIATIKDQDDSPSRAGATETQANARLIAAAPELLAALQRILEADEMDPRLWDSICGASIAYADAFAAARAAIAKATS